MAIDFPSSPSVNDQFTAGNVIYEWDGNKWVTLNTLLNKGYSDTFFSTPSGTTAERPSVANTGYFRFNETLGRFEGYDGSNWISFGEYGNSVKFDDISSSFNGILVDFSITVGSVAHSPLAVNTTLVSLGGVIQEPGVDYTINGSTLTFTTAPTAGLAFHAIDLGATGISTVPPDGSITTAKLDTDLTVDLASGTAAVPSLTFDADTGLYSPGADQVAISTNGAGRLFIDASGDVGIGTSSPGRTLDVIGSIRSGGSSNPYIALNDQTAEASFEISGLQTRISSGTSQPLVFRTGSDERMRIVPTGAIGLSGANYGTSGQVMTSNGSGSAISWENVRDIPQNAQTASYTLVAADAGKHVSITTGGVTVPASVFSVGDAISIYNNSASAQTITEGSSATLRLAGDGASGNKTLDGYGLATILCVASNVFVIGGAGVS